MYASCVILYLKPSDFIVHSTSAARLIVQVTLIKSIYQCCLNVCTGDMIDKFYLPMLPECLCRQHDW